MKSLVLAIIVAAAMTCGALHIVKGFQAQVQARTAVINQF